MADDLSVAFERLRTSTSRLNAICDVAAQTVRDIEAFLEDAQVGIEACVEIKEVRHDDGDSEVHWLAYEKHKSGKFRILVGQTPSWASSPDEVTSRPWSECSRDEKLESIEKLPELLISLAERVQTNTAKAESVISAVNASLQLLPPKKRKGD